MNSSQFEAIWWGGPNDGQAIALPEGTHMLSVPVAINWAEWLAELGAGDIPAPMDGSGIPRDSLPCGTYRMGLSHYLA